MKREYGQSPGGDPLNGQWVRRGTIGQWIGASINRFELALPHGSTL